MSEFAEMHIFFVVTTAAVVLVTALVAYALYRVVRILRNVERISDMAAEEGTLLRGDIAGLRSSIQTEGFKFKTLLGVFRRSAERMVKRTKKDN